MSNLISEFCDECEIWWHAYSLALVLFHRPKSWDILMLSRRMLHCCSNGGQSMSHSLTVYMISHHQESYTYQSLIHAMMALNVITSGFFIEFQELWNIHHYISLWLLLLRLEMLKWQLLTKNGSQLNPKVNYLVDRNMMQIDKFMQMLWLTLTCIILLLVCKQWQIFIRSLESLLMKLLQKLHQKQRSRYEWLALGVQSSSVLVKGWSFLFQWLT